ncbi:ATP-grasp domain-containing protein [Salinactinospora qingdaonensis]|uniref:ATP-grasp domain-containing protein n=1 Tax=Salinactinospora qingdaonensis TaxID=702744 RepID=A0ABP7ERJ6_9ACTN
MPQLAGRQDAPSGAPSSRPDAFILSGSFLAVARAPLYLEELTRRGLRVLLITPSRWRDAALTAMHDTEHPAAAVHEVAFVEGEAGRESSYVADAVAAARRWRERYRIVGACAVGETQVEPTGLLADGLGLPSPGLRATRACRSKYLQRWYLPEFSPAALVIPPGERERVDLTHAGLPAVIKPSGGHSSSGVQTVNDADELRARLAEYPDHETVLVEERVRGQEFSVESLVQGGEVVFASVTRKETTDTGTATTFVELSHTVPNDHTALDATLLDANRRMLRALAFEDGVSHAEWRIDPEGRPVLMEVAARPPGDGICELFRLATGRSLEPEIIRVALGEPVAAPRFSRQARQIYLEHQPGLLRDVTVDWEGVQPQWVGSGDLWPRIGPAAPEDPASLRAVLVHREHGTELGALRSSDDRVASVFIDAPTVAQVDALERRVREAVAVHTDPAPTDPPLESVTHVLVGYSPVMLGKLDSHLPEGAVLVVEEPDVIEARGLADLAQRHACVAALLPGPSQDEKHPERITDTVPRPPQARVVVPVVEYGVVTAATLAEAWGLPGAGPKAARILRDKALLRETIDHTDIAQPQWTVAHGPEDVARFRSRHGGACVLKPTNRQASLGVQLLTADDDTTQAWQVTTAADEPWLRARYATTERVLVEQRMAGREVSVEALVHNGAVAFSTITAKSVLESRHPVETGHALPADVDEGTAAALREAMATLVAATGFDYGVLHAEWMLDEGRPQLVECAGRLPGDGITVLVDLAYDTDVLHQLLGVLEGRAPDVRAEAVRGAAVRFLIATPGTVTAVEGADTARDRDGVHEVHLNVEPGGEVHAATSSWERAGFVIAAGADAEEAARNADRAATAITVTTREHDSGGER